MLTYERRSFSISKILGANNVNLGDTLASPQWFSPLNFRLNQQWVLIAYCMLLFFLLLFLVYPWHHHSMDECHFGCIKTFLEKRKKEKKTQLELLCHFGIWNLYFNYYKIVDIYGIEILSLLLITRIRIIKSWCSSIILCRYIFCNDVHSALKSGFLNYYYYYYYYYFG